VKILAADSSVSVSLHVEGYEFPELKGPGDMDADWLVIRGAATSPDEQWTFRHPCLLAGEAQWIGEWLRRVLDGEILPDSDDEVRTIEHVEPLIRFNLVAADSDDYTIRVYLDHEASPPSRSTFESREDSEYYIDVAVDRRGIARALDEWDRDLAPYPIRS
jgi:hypothetical protein